MYQGYSQFKGYYVYPDIKCGWLLPNGIFYPCDYKHHRKLLDFLLSNGIITKKDVLIKFNEISNFYWIDIDYRQVELTKEQKEFVENNNKNLHGDFIKELKKLE